MYATTARPDLAKALGFVGAKIPLPYGPGDGDEGMRKNIERIKQASARVGVGGERHLLACHGLASQ